MTIIKIYPAARKRIIQIYNYTYDQWGKSQAEKYVRGLNAHMDKLKTGSSEHKAVAHKTLNGVFVTKYQKHFIFYKIFPSKTIGILSILHENMDIPNRLKEDMFDEHTQK